MRPRVPRSLILFACLTVVTGASVRAQAPPDEAATRGVLVPDVELIAEDSTTFHFSDFLGKPVIISPIFTSCPHTCSHITESLRDALAQIGEPEVGYHVLTVSFDPSDGPAALRDYRERLSLPDGWTLAVATPENLTALLDAIDFNYSATEDGGFAHPNLVAVLRPDLKVYGYVHGVTYEATAIRGALERAVRSASLVERFKPLILTVAMLGLLATTVALVATRKRQPA